MTDRRGRKPPTTDESVHLSDEDVERRLDGGAGLGGPVDPRAPATDTPPAGPRRPSRGRGLVWRDAGLAIALVAFLFLGARFALNWEPAGARATGAPAASNVALASSSPGLGPSVTPQAVPTPSATPFQVIPSLATPTPVPTPTPEPTPTPTPAPTQTPTTAPGPTPGTATLTVYVNPFINDDGGTITKLSTVTVHVSGANASPSSFSGSASRVVTVRAGTSYSVSASGPSGYAVTTSKSQECSGKLPGGGHGICTITANDKPAALRVTTVVNGGTAVASDFVIQITGTDVVPVGGAPGSGSGFRYTFDANAAYGHATLVASGYTVTWSTSCTGTAADAINGVTNLCTVTLTWTGAMPVHDLPLFVLAVSPLAIGRRRPAPTR